MDTADQTLKEVEQAAKTIADIREKMKPNRELLRMMDRAGKLTKKQQERMTDALGETRGRKAAEPTKAKQTPKPQTTTSQKEAVVDALKDSALLQQ
jgi:ribosomal protein L16 Arg81 hydroxylase